MSSSEDERELVIDLERSSDGSDAGPESTQPVEQRALFMGQMLEIFQGMGSLLQQWAISLVVRHAVGVLLANLVGTQPYQAGDRGTMLQRHGDLWKKYPTHQWRILGDQINRLSMLISHGCYPRDHPVIEGVYLKLLSVLCPALGKKQPCPGLTCAGLRKADISDVLEGKTHNQIVCFVLKLAANHRATVHGLRTELIQTKARLQLYERAAGSSAGPSGGATPGQKRPASAPAAATPGPKRRK